MSILECRGVSPCVTLQVGCAPLGGLYFRDVTQADVREVVIEAVTTLGITEFDTAPWYGRGRSEADLGRALAVDPALFSVANVFTKVGRYIESRAALSEKELARAPTDDHCYSRADRDAYPDVVCVHDYTAHGVRRSLEQSRTRLQGARISGVRLHDAENDERFAESTDAEHGGLVELFRLRKAGVVPQVSLGMNDPQYIVKFLTWAESRGLRFDNILMAGAFNLMDQSGDIVLSECQRLGIQVHNAGVFGAGFLFGAEHYRYRDTAMPAQVDKRRQLLQICEDESVELPALACAFAQLPTVVSRLVVGVASAEELRQTTRWARTRGEKEDAALRRALLRIAHDGLVDESSRRMIQSWDASLEA